MEFVGLDYDTYADRSPFRLSGGQMRRVAIAGVIAIHPQYLILDEPSAGLDPVGRREIFAEIQRWHKEKNITVILVSHNMDDISRMANRLIVLSEGQILIDGEPLDVFATQQDKLHSAGVAVPPVTEVLQYLKGRGLAVEDRVHTVVKPLLLFITVWEETNMLKDITLGQYFPGESFSAPPGSPAARS